MGISALTKIWFLVVCRILRRWYRRKGCRRRRTVMRLAVRGARRPRRLAPRCFRSCSRSEGRLSESSVDPDDGCFRSGPQVRTLCPCLNSEGWGPSLTATCIYTFVLARLMWYLCSGYYPHSSTSEPSSFFIYLYTF